MRIPLALLLFGLLFIGGYTYLNPGLPLWQQVSAGAAVVVIGALLMVRVERGLRDGRIALNALEAHRGRDPLGFWALVGFYGLVGSISLGFGAWLLVRGLL